MARFAPAKQDIFDEFAAEILHNYADGRWAVAVDGRAGAGQAEVADGIAAAIQARGAAAVRATTDGVDDFRSTVLVPFRAEEGNAILVVDGRELLRAPLSSIFVYTIWIGVSPAGTPDPSEDQLDYERTVRPRIAATANLDNSDPEHPRRTFSDSC